MRFSYDELFALTPFQHKELWEAYQERERISEIIRARLLVTIVNANRWDDKQRETTIEDVLPWYSEYIAEQRKTEPVVSYPEIDQSVPQLERITKRLLEQNGLDPDEVKKDSAEWKDAEELAKKCLTGGNTSETTTPTDGFVIQKADPAVWGEKPPWEDDD